MQIAAETRPPTITNCTKALKHVVPLYLPLFKNIQNKKYRSVISQLLFIPLLVNFHPHLEVDKESEIFGDPQSIQDLE